MPTYDYVCPKCGSTKEVFHSMNETPDVKCDEGKCKGTMEKGYINGPYIHPSAIPTRKNNSGISQPLRKSKQY